MSDIFDKVLARGEAAPAVDDDDLALAVLLRAYNAPQIDTPAMRGHLARLVETGFLKNTARPWQSVPWWSLTPAGKAIVHRFAMWTGSDKEAFLRRTYSVFPSRW